MSNNQNMKHEQDVRGENFKTNTGQIKRNNVFSKSTASVI